MKSLKLYIFYVLPVAFFFLISGCGEKGDSARTASTQSPNQEQQIPPNKNVTVTCTIASAFIDRALSLARPGTTRKDVIDSVKRSGLYEIELTFNPSLANGTGKVKGFPVQYTTRGDTVLFMTGKDASEASIYHRREKTFEFADSATTMVPFENCRELSE